MFLSPLLSTSLIPSILQSCYPCTRNVWEVLRVHMMSVSLKVFPGTAHLEEQSCKGKSKPYFRDFNQEREHESQFAQPRTQHSQEGSGIAPSQGSWSLLHGLLAQHHVKKAFLSKTFRNNITENQNPLPNLAPKAHKPHWATPTCRHWCWTTQSLQVHFKKPKSTWFSSCRSSALFIQLQGHLDGLFFLNMWILCTTIC